MAQWQSTVTFTNKSTYSFASLNRESDNVQYLRDKLETIGFRILFSYPVKNDYVKTDYPTVSAINNLRRNINALVQGFYSIPAPVIVVNLEQKQLFDYNSANELEQNLQALYDLINNIINYTVYSGQIYAGQNQTYL